MSKGKLLQYFAGVVLAGAGLVIFFRDPNLNVVTLIEQIKTTKFGVIVLIVVLSMGSLWLRTLRWRILLPSPENSNKRALFSVVTIAFMVNNIMPARLGEAVRAVLLWKRNGFTLTTSIGSLVVERVIDSLTFLSFFFLPVFFSGKLSRFNFYAFVAALIFFAVVLCFFLYRCFPKRFGSLLGRAVTLFPQRISEQIKKIAAELVCNLEWTFSLKRVFSVIVLSFFLAFSYSAILLILVGERGSFGIWESMFGQAFAAFGTAIPLAPGFVGTLHAALLQGFMFVGVPPEKAGVAVVLYHALPFLTVTIAGLFFLISTNITFKEVSNAAEQVKTSKKELARDEC